MNVPPPPGSEQGGNTPPPPPPADAPDPRWPFPQGPTAADEAAESKVLNLAAAFIAESKRVRYLQLMALGLAGGVALLLLLLLFCVVKVGFENHLGKAEEMLIKVAERPWSSSTPAQADTFTLPNVEKRGIPARGNAASAPAASASEATSASLELAATERKSLHELLATGLKSLAYSTVAVISILVVAICIITLGIAKVVFAMTPHRLTDESKAGPDSDKGGKGSSDLVLPNLEFAKEFTKLFTDLLKRHKD
ncbi:hypothetical protein FHT39_003781 [Mitsuaria sp. BK045]|uniref:hypothetical protein n=1 Tax=unclassified Roseateles TaxID=2626991 RepID=UPI0016215F2F|nr:MULTISPECIES: hypothetical protein [unclassified Roseateles]MBB3295101.1 hypothetical protein [Mitsuaria sp. BK041]MBB3364317.1 hypothetical protein [Mitsuaria sp. BK045]